MQGLDKAQDHEFFMRAALEEAKLALAAGERPIGAVIVHRETIVGRGRAHHHQRTSKIAHAEMNALLNAEAYLYDHEHDDCILYTTLEPCVMCLGAVVMSDIQHIVFSMADAHIMPAQMLEMPYVRRHIKSYLGGVLEKESSALWEHYSLRELCLIRNG